MNKGLIPWVIKEMKIKTMRTFLTNQTDNS